MTAEEYVREMWERVDTTFNGDRKQFMFFTSNPLYHAVYGDTLNELWERGRQFTEQRIEEVRQLQEEIDSITGDVELCASIPHPSEEAIYRRILARLEELLAAKSAGLSAKALEGK